MKKNLIQIFAVIIALTFTASTFPVKGDKRIIVYLVYKCNGGNPCVISNYFQQTTQPPTCEGDQTVCWIAVNDANGVVTQGELTIVCGSLDKNGNGSITDEAETSAFQKQTCARIIL